MLFEAPYICAYSLKNNELHILFSIIFPIPSISTKKLTIQYHFCVCMDILIFFNVELKNKLMKLLEAFRYQIGLWFNLSLTIRISNVFFL